MLKMESGYFTFEEVLEVLFFYNSTTEPPINKYLGLKWFQFIPDQLYSSVVLNNLKVGNTRTRNCTVRVFRTG